MKKYIIPFVLALGLIAVALSCQSEDKQTSSESDTKPAIDETAFKRKCNTATAMSQAALLASVGQAINDGGFPGAVDYCNVNASPLTDSLSVAYELNISRITNRFRNPNNKLQSQEDKRAWTYYKTKTAQTSTADTVLYDRAGNPTYYKPIWIGAQLCLNCHGSRSTEISLETLEAIDARYPSDAAVNYQLGELRGLWKVEVQ